MSDRGLLMRRMAAYAALPLFSSLSPFVVLPIIARQASTDQWAALTIGQSVGLVGALAVGYGWNVVGPARVAQAEPADRPTIYAESVVSRLWLLVLAAPLAAVVSWVLAPGDASVAMLCVLMSWNGIAVGLSISWFCIGSGRPGDIARYEVVPRTISSLVAASMVLVSGWLWLYPVLLVVSFLVTTGFFTRTVVSWKLLGTLSSFDSVARLLRQHVVPTSVELSAGSYTMGGGSLVSTVLPASQIGHYGSADRINAAGMQAIVAVGNALSPWVAESHGRTFVRRARVALSAHALLGVLGWAVLTIVGPPLSALMFGDRFGFSTATGAAFGGYYFAVSMGTAISRHVLVSRGRVRVILAGTLSGAAVGIPAVVVGASLLGPSGGASGLALGEATVCLVLALPAWRAIRREGAAPPEPALPDDPDKENAR